MPVDLFTCVQVGQPLLEAPAPEDVQFLWIKNNPITIILAMPSPSESTIDAVQQGGIKVGLVVESPVMCLLVYGAKKFLGRAFFNASLFPENIRPELPKRVGPKDSFPVKVILVDSLTGVVQAVHVMKMPPVAAKLFHFTVRTQLEYPITIAENAKYTLAYLDRYPTVVFMLIHAKMYGLLGGELKQPV